MVYTGVGHRGERVGTEFAYVNGMATGGKKSGLAWPEWRLYANFLHRELARLWYGKKSVFTLVKGDHENEEFWELLAAIWAIIIQRFGLAYGLTIEEMAKRSESCCKGYDQLIGLGFPYGTRLHQLTWAVRCIFGDKLASEFLYDFQITEIIALAAISYGYAAQGKMPPYERGKRLGSIEFYEELPVAPELEAQFYGKNLA